MKGRGKIGLFCLAVLAALSVGATLAAAAWSSELYTGNEYRVQKYKTSLEEAFDAPDNWQPGVTIQKEFWVSNNVSDADSESETPVIARVEIGQSWIRRADIYASASNADEKVRVAAAGEELPLTVATGNGPEYAALLNFNKNSVVVLRSGMASETGLRLGPDYVDSVEDAAGKWLIVSETPDASGNYVLYYIDVIQAGEDTPVFLESVTMNPILENTVISKETWYEGDNQVTQSTVNSDCGYDSCRYTMDIRMTTVQATTAAVEQVYSNGYYEEVIDYLAHNVADEGVYDATDLEKTLTITYDSSSGELSYIPYRTETGSEEGNWFMSFTDMLPGGIYIDGMTVENTSSIAMNLYMKVVSRDDNTVIQDELLEQIDMTVTYDGEVIYEGKATGVSYSGTNLQNLILLASLDPDSSGRIEVTLELDPDMECDPLTGKCIYSDQLSKIDWYFYISGYTSDGNSSSDSGGNSSSSGSSGDSSGSSSGTSSGTSGSVSSGSPSGELYSLEPSLAKTGDQTRTYLLAGLAALSICLLAATAVVWKKTGS